MLNLNQLRIFWAVAHSPSLTRAAKQLGLTQPSLSQALAKLEKTIGERVFDRIDNRLVLTDAGRFLLRRGERILAEVDETEAGLAEFRSGHRGRIAIGALASLGRSLIPDAYARALRAIPDLEIDLHELAPGEAIEQLYGRTIQIALLSAHSIAANRLSFTKTELATDPYAFAVPKGMRLAQIADPEKDLSSDDRRLVHRVIQFNFGNAHNQRVEDWYRRVLPRHEVIATCRTYEAALAMVEAGLGVALVPLMTAQLRGRLLFDVDLYAVPGLTRPVTALVPPQYARVEPWRTFLAALQAAGEALDLPRLLPAPRFLVQAPETKVDPPIGVRYGTEKSKRAPSHATSCDTGDGVGTETLSREQIS
jgi:LysR family transcriptional regulator, transcription activator of glutamate synthase operon